MFALSGASFSNGTVVNLTAELTRLAIALNNTIRANETTLATFTSEPYQLALGLMAIA